MSPACALSATIDPPPPGQEELLEQLGKVSADLADILVEREQAYELLERAHRDTLQRLTVAAEFKDGDTGTHLVRIGRLAALLARLAGWSPEQAALLAEAAPMHDVGKIGVPDAILKKAQGLSEDEWAVMRRHPEFGARILGGSGIPVLEMAAEIAYCHHEKFDGTGYPRGLAGNAIPQSARIVSLIDYFDALTMDRVYRKALADDVVVEMIRAQSGMHFDPELAAVFLGNTPLFVALRDRINAEAARGSRTPGTILKMASPVSGT
jgi:putative two-component system response regulator